MNLRDLRAALREMLDDQTEPPLWPDETVDRKLNNAVREACIRARLLKDDAISKPTLCSYPIVAGQVSVKFNPAILVPRSGALKGTACKLWALMAEGMDKVCPGWDTDSGSPGAPEYMVMDLAQKTIRLHPVPDVAYTLQLRVWRMPLDSERMKAEDSEPVIQIPDAEELCHWAAHELYLKADSETEDKQKSAEHLALFEQRFGPRPSLLEMARWADSPPRIRRSHLF